MALSGLRSAPIGAGYWRGKTGRKFGRVLVQKMKFGTNVVENRPNPVNMHRIGLQILFSSLRGPKYPK